jgi:hypothetical protein
MKALSSVIILLCIVANVAIGTYLWRISGYGMGEDHFSDYGLSLTIPRVMKSTGSNFGTNLLQQYQFKNRDQDGVTTSLEIYIDADLVDSNITKEEYKQASKKYYESITENKFTYIDGGITRNQNGVKMYYDTVLFNRDDFAKQRKQKVVTFFHRNNRIEMFWVDDIDDFDSNVQLFNDILETIKLY